MARWRKTLPDSGSSTALIRGRSTIERGPSLPGTNARPDDDATEPRTCRRVSRGMRLASCGLVTVAQPGKCNRTEAAHRIMSRHSSRLSSLSQVTEPSRSARPPAPAAGVQMESPCSFLFFERQSVGGGYPPSARPGSCRLERDRQGTGTIRGRRSWAFLPQRRSVWYVVARLPARQDPLHPTPAEFTAVGVGADRRRTSGSGMNGWTMARLLPRKAWRWPSTNHPRRGRRGRPPTCPVVRRDRGYRAPWPRPRASPSAGLNTHPRAGRSQYRRPQVSGLQ